MPPRCGAPRGCRYGQEPVGREGRHRQDRTPAPCPQRWMLLPQGLPGDCHPVLSPGTGPRCRSPEAGAKHRSWPGEAAWHDIGEWGGEQRERAILRICLLLECLIPSPWLRLPLSHQSCPATSRKACAAGTRIHPVTSNGCAAQGRGRAPTTPLARVRSWLPTRGPQAAPGTPQPPVPRARTSLRTPSSPMPVG